MAVPGATFHYEVEETEDANHYVTRTIKCHGKLVTENTAELRELVSPLIARGGGRIVLDFSDLEYIDSSGLGALVGLKVSAINRGLCILELVNLTPRVQELLSITYLLQLFSQWGKSVV
jgi:anti-sigma B factor antagonist